MKKLLLAGLIAGGVFVGGCSSDSDDGMSSGGENGGENGGEMTVPAATPGVGNSVYDNIFNDESLSTLLAAIDAAGLADTLDNEDSEFTVFAPNNAAFEAFIAGNDSFDDAEALLAAGPDVLAPILTYHVLGSTVVASAAAEAAPADLETVNGATVALATSDTAPTGLSIGGTDVLVGDSNYDADSSVGVVHIIASVLIPPAE